MNEGLIFTLYYVYGYIAVFSIVFVSPQDILSWDLAIANENGINFFYSNGTLIKFSIDERNLFNDFYMLTYDHLNEQIIFNVEVYEADIFAFNFSGKRLTPLVSQEKHNVLGLASDPVSRSLFWTDGNAHTIWKRSLHNETSTGEVLLAFDSIIPAGIAVSICKRLLFWTNINHLSASIHRSQLDGSNSEIIIKDDLFVPLAITVDETNEKLYWTDDQRGIYFKIESSDFDGKNRKTIIQGTNQAPIGIVALNNVLYWTDETRSSVWKASLDSTTDGEGTLFYKFDSKMGTPHGITAYRSKHFDCDAIVPGQTTPIYAPSPEPTTDMSENSYCLNEGEHVAGECRCKKGYSGLRCEVSECHNFCLNEGRCFVNEIGQTKCECPEGYGGDRCQLDVCRGHCLNGGKCTIRDGVPACSCDSKHSGKRCEIPLDFICHQACASFFENVVCNCNKTSSSNCGKTSDLGLGSGRCEQQHVVSLVLICLEGVTMLVVVVLARKVCLLRRRPRIKKRIIINKGVRSQTPMTARPHVGSAEQCEITIENCCNMNICETPCFEPSLRSPRTSSKSTSKKTEDKKNLLKNMEGDFDSSDVCYT